MKWQHSASSGALTQFEYDVLKAVNVTNVFRISYRQGEKTQESWILTNAKSIEWIRMGVRPQAEEERLTTSSQRWGLSAGILLM